MDDRPKFEKGVPSRHTIRPGGQLDFSGISFIREAMCSAVLRENQERKTADGVDCNQISLLICIDKVTEMQF